MRVIRTALAMPDSITASAASAREEIGRAVAARIRETTSTKELAKVTEEVLPQIEKFLESPEEKRLRRLRTGTIIASIGMGVAIALSILSSVIGKDKEEMMFLAGLGLVTFFIGVGFILNGVFLTVPKRSLPDRSPNPELEPFPTQQPQSFLEMPARAETNDLYPSSVTENTTKHLKNER
jgi:hypothetical protein